MRKNDDDLWVQRNATLAKKKVQTVERIFDNPPIKPSVKYIVQKWFIFVLHFFSVNLIHRER